MADSGCSGYAVSQSIYISLSSFDGWGAWPFEERPRTTMAVKLQAIARTQSGLSIESSWFILPVELCAGCVAGESVNADSGRIAYIEKKLCSLGTCTYEVDGEATTLACNNPAGLQDGSSGCPNNPSVPCEGLQSGIEECRLTVVSDGGEVCSEAQLLGENVRSTCVVYDSCDDLNQ